MGGAWKLSEVEQAELLGSVERLLERTALEGGARSMIVRAGVVIGMAR